MEVGQLFQNRYRVDAILHRGTKSVVAAASHLQIAGRVAIKTLQPTVATDVEAVSRFINEAQHAAMIRSPHVLAVLDFGRLDDGRPYLISELIAGATLHAMLGMSRFAPAQTIELGIQLCRGLTAIHQRGIAHRNIEPANLVIALDRPHLVIVDLFFSRTIGAPSFAATGRTIIGRPPFTAPEQLRDPASADARSDLWSAGVVLATMLAGEPPFSAPSFAELVAKLVDGAHPRLAAGIPPPLAAVISRCLAADPSKRYASADELATALDRCPRV